MFCIIYLACLTCPQAYFQTNKPTVKPATISPQQNAPITMQTHWSFGIETFLSGLYWYGKKETVWSIITKRNLWTHILFSWYESYTDFSKFALRLYLDGNSPHSSIYNTLILYNCHMPGIHWRNPMTSFKKSLPSPISYFATYAFKSASVDITICHVLT